MFLFTARRLVHSAGRAGSRAADPGVALGEGSQKHTSFEFNRTVTVSLYKCQLNINGIFSGD